MVDPKEKRIVAIVDAPEIILTEEEDAGHVLIKFYTALGWNGEDELDPCRIRTTEAVFNQLFGLMLEKCPDTVGIGMVMVNKAPGVGENIPSNKVYLLEGWIIPQDEGLTE